ncbi:MAG: ABC transporter ATP-binding protein [Candidatus Lokiarchaeota archaeon]|nr:ABC transporter ATP-binding protein [Candidatus Lokiarchaeota archaeon]
MKSGGKLRRIRKEVLGDDADPDERDVRHYPSTVLLKRTWRYLKPYIPQFLVVLVIITINAFVKVYPVRILASAIDTAEKVMDGRLPLSEASSLYGLGFQLMLFYCLSWALTTSNHYFMGYISQHTTFDLRQEMFIKLQHLSFAYYDKRKAGKIMSRVLSDVETIHNLMTNGFPMLLGDTISIVFIVYLLIDYSPELTAITFIVGPLFFLVTSFVSKRARRIYDKSRQTIAEVYTKLEQGVSGMKTTMAFTREEQSAQEFDVANKANMETNIQAGKLMASVGPIFQTIGFGVLSLVFVAAFFFLRQEVPPGSGNYFFDTSAFVAFILLVLQFYSPINQLATFYSQIQAAFAGGSRIFSTLDEEIEIKNKTGAIADHVMGGRVEFKNVCFHYVEGIPVIKDVSVSIPARSSLAIVGYTGAGKTTFINLLCRFYDVASGQILVDGIDVRDMTLSCLRKQLGIVLQHPFLFTDTVKENIRYGSSATDEEIVAVAKQIGAHDFIMALENGYDTVVRERGLLLSQGQRQLVSFARALLVNPKILILDEATSSLDSYSEMLLQKAIEEITKDRTSIIIAHRLSTIRNADKILVLDKGEAIEYGTHDELLAKDGLYAKLYKLQFKDLELTRKADAASSAGTQ